MAGWLIGASPPIPINFVNYGFTGYGEYAYLIGGYSYINEGELDWKNEVYKYNVNTNIWTSGVSAPTNSRIEISITVGEKIVCFGEENNILYVNIFNINSNLWDVQKTSTPPYNLSMYAQNFVLVRNKVYYTTATADYSTFIRDFLVYDVENNTWASTSPAPYNRARFGASSYLDNLYIIGGDKYIGPGSTDFDWEDVDRLDIKDTRILSWSQGASMIKGKYKFGSVEINGEIYAIGGTVNADETGIIRDVSDVQVYSISENSWRNIENAPVSGGLLDIGIASISSRIVFIWKKNNITHIYDTRSAFISNPMPTAGFVNEKIPNTFSWTLSSNPLSDRQQSATFQWRARNASAFNTINVGSTQSVTIPANTLSNGEFEWRVSATNTSGIVAPFTDWFLLTTVDERPNKPTGLYPNTGARDGTKTIQFSWLHNSPLSTPQSAFELQMTYDGGYTWRALSNKVATAVTQFTAAANTILPTDQTGRIGWRARTYNSDNVMSEWSDTAFFIVHPAPQTPNWISVETGRSRPLARWTSIGQVGFQLQVTSGSTIVFDSGETFGTDTEYRIPTFLNNGVYTFRIRIKNIRGLESAWANRSVSINARHSLNITLQGQPVKNGAQLTFNVEVRASG